MPCSCDGFEVRDARVDLSLREQIEHQKDMLCSARSLIHKMLKFIDDPGRPGVSSMFPQELRTKASAHIAWLVTHKREEHLRDVNHARARLENLRKEREAHIQQDAQRVEIKRRLQKEITELEERFDKTPTDAELLG